MFRLIAIIAFVATFVGIAAYCLISPCSKQCRWTPIAVLGRLVRVFTLLLSRQKLSALGILKKLVYVLALLCFVVLAVTGFYPLLVLNEHISGYLMMIHATFAPVFAVCLAILAIMWASNNRFSKNDWPGLQKVLSRVTRSKPSTELISRSYDLSQKIAFWLIISLALPLILSIILSMFGLFGTHWQELLLAAHRWTALVFAVVAIVHTDLVVRTQMREP